MLTSLCSSLWHNTVSSCEIRAGQLENLFVYWPPAGTQLYILKQSISAKLYILKQSISAKLYGFKLKFSFEKLHIYHKQTHSSVYFQTKVF